MSLLDHSHVNVLGVKVSAIDMHSAIDLLERALVTGNRGYICFTGVHGVMEAQRDPVLSHILNNALINAPDGMPMSWVGHLDGYSEMDRVFGPEFMEAVCSLSERCEYRHFLYGGKPGVAEELKRTLQLRFPKLKIVGIYTPPFRELNQEEEIDLINRLAETRPDIMWVGLGTPKQERFMAKYIHKLEVPVLAGVGAAFDYHTGRIRDCAPWIKRAGLQWLHRLFQDPARLWRRYLINNPAFIYSIALQLLGLRSYPVDSQHSEPIQIKVGNE
jgi:N-acetylglucosaminyldiphosphoundecaprenol N-acetyl-beta-D-mannosaminyltransferase